MGVRFPPRAYRVDAIVSGNLEMLKDITDDESSQNPDIAGKVQDTYYFQPNKTKLLFAEYARTNIKNASEPCGEVSVPEAQKPVRPDPAKLYAEENAIGKMLYYVTAVSLTSINTKKCEDDLLVAATQALIAERIQKQQP